MDVKYKYYRLVNQIPKDIRGICEEKLGVKYGLMQDWSKRGWAKNITIAFVKNKPIGWCLMSSQQLSVFVKPYYRKKKVGSKLLSKTIKMCCEDYLVYYIDPDEKFSFYDKYFSDKRRKTFVEFRRLDLSVTMKRRSL